MPYIEEKCKAGKTLEVRRYYDSRHHPKGERRAKKEKATPERIKKANSKKARRIIRRLANANFADGDYLFRGDFLKRDMTDEEMQQLIVRFIRKLRTAFKKEGRKLKYIYCKEIGKRGGRHIHMLMPKCSLDLIRKCWTYGGIHINFLYSNGQYRKIAEYFVKYSDKTAESLQQEGKHIGKRWYASQNLIKPVPIKKVISAKKFRKDIRTPKGYYLDKDSVENFISDVTGYEYLSYTLIESGSG